MKKNVLPLGLGLGGLLALSPYLRSQFQLKNEEMSPSNDNQMNLTNEEVVQLEELPSGKEKKKFVKQLKVKYGKI